MAEQYRFFGSAVGDIREYDQTEFADTFYQLVDNGFVLDELNELVVSQNTPAGMSVLVDTGYAWINGYLYKNDDINELAIATSDQSNPRIDLIVLKLDVITARSIVATVKTGTPGPAPVAPTLTQNAQIWEIPLAEVYVNTGVLSITDANITDKRQQSFPKSYDAVKAMIDSKAPLESPTFTGTITSTGSINITGANKLIGSYGGGGISTNVAIGTGSLSANTTGVANTSIGRNTLNVNTTGGANTAIGYQSLLSNTTSNANTAIGNEVLKNNTTGANNTAIGYQALLNNTTTSYNTAIGRQALSNNTTFSNITGVGYNAQADKSNQVVLGDTNVVEVKTSGKIVANGAEFSGTVSGVAINYTATIPYTSWTGSSAPYSKAVTVTGILSTDTPIIDIVQTGTYATDQTMIENWGKVYRAVTSANTITFYATAIPSADIPIQAKVVR
jgi:hypothetical protein